VEPKQRREGWDKGKLVGQKPPRKPKDISAIRIQLQNSHRERDLAMFNLAMTASLTKTAVNSRHRAVNPRTCREEP